MRQKSQVAGERAKQRSDPKLSRWTLRAEPLFRWYLHGEEGTFRFHHGGIVPGGRLKKGDPRPY